MLEIRPLIRKNSKIRNPTILQLWRKFKERKTKFKRIFRQRSHLIYLASFEKKDEEKKTRPESDFYSRTPVISISWEFCSLNRERGAGGESGQTRAGLKTRKFSARKGLAGCLTLGLELVYKQEPIAFLCLYDVTIS
jgi:hypothetical protein